MISNNYCSKEVNAFLIEKNHPLIDQIEALRLIILDCPFQLTENIKWNGPNYVFEKLDRITIKINPPTKIQVILHCGTKVLEPALKNNLCIIKSEFIKWITHDRAVLNFQNLTQIDDNKDHLKYVFHEWLNAPF